MRYTIIIVFLLLFVTSIAQREEGVRVINVYDSIAKKVFSDYSKVIKEKGQLSFHLSISDNCMCEGNNCSNLNFKTSKKRKVKVNLSNIAINRSYPNTKPTKPKSSISGSIQILKIKRKRVKVSLSVIEIINNSGVKWIYEFKGWMPVLSIDNKQDFLKYQKNCFDGYGSKYLNS